MSHPKLITVVGGGLAGLTLGIALRLEGIPVVIWEAGDYPRHRVCGEFISGRAEETLARLGLLSLLREAGGRPAITSAFYASKRRFFHEVLPRQALCLSRYVLDALLAQKFRELGGELRTESRWREGSFEEGTVRASGRRVQTREGAWRRFGLKAHAQGVNLEADLEMHFLENAYVGLCRISDVEVNVCGLFRAGAQRSERTAPLEWKDRLRGDPGTLLFTRLEKAEWIESSFCSVAGLSLQGRLAEGEFAIGDALAMTPPVTGNGMSMAFESAELALGPLKEFSLGRLSWNDAKARALREFKETFSRRLWRATWLERGIFQRGIRTMLFPVAARSTLFWKLSFQGTR